MYEQYALMPSCDLDKHLDIRQEFRHSGEIQVILQNISVRTQIKTKNKMNLTSETSEST